LSLPRRFETIFAFRLSTPATAQKRRKQQIDNTQTTTDKMKNQNIMHTIRNHTGLLGTCALLLFAGTALGTVLTPTYANFPGSGGTRTISIGSAPPGVGAWSTSSFIHITSLVLTGTGGILTYTVDPNYGCDRSGTILIGAPTTNPLTRSLPTKFVVKQATQAPPTALEHTFLAWGRKALLSWSPPPCASKIVYYQLSIDIYVNYGSGVGRWELWGQQLLSGTQTSYEMPLWEGRKYRWTVKAADRVSDYDGWLGTFWTSNAPYDYLSTTIW
jgi:hypothetical protein